MTKATLSGPLPTWLANAASDLLHDAMAKGMEADEAVCLVVTVAADYARHCYGPAYLTELATIITDRASAPLPEIVHD